MSFRGSCDFRVVMDAHNVSTDQSFETEAHSKKGARDDKVSGASEVTNDTISLWERGLRRPENKQLKKLSEFFDVSIAYLTGNSYNRHAEDDFESEAVWLENVDFLEDMFEKATRLSDDSLMVIREMIERTLIADDAQGKLKPEGMYTVKITKHGDEE